MIIVLLKIRTLEKFCFNIYRCVPWGLGQVLHTSEGLNHYVLIYYTKLFKCVQSVLKSPTTLAQTCYWNYEKNIASSIKTSKSSNKLSCFQRLRRCSSSQCAICHGECK